jgi:hypothetical protein
MKKLMYLGGRVFLFIFWIVSCKNPDQVLNGPSQEMRIVSKTDTIVMLDPATGKEITKVIESKDTIWTIQKVK